MIVDLFWAVHRNDHVVDLEVDKGFRVFLQEYAIGLQRKRHALRLDVGQEGQYVRIEQGFSSADDQGDAVLAHLIHDLEETVERNYGPAVGFVRFPVLHVSLCTPLGAHPAAQIAAVRDRK